MSQRSSSLPHLHITFTVAMVSVLLSGLLPAAPAPAHAQTPPNLEDMKMALYQQHQLASSSRLINGKPFAQSLPSMMSISQPLITDQLDGSLAVFQSFRDGNWEVYRADNGGASVSRLTNNAASDITPRITLDGSKVVFASNRDSNYEIYTMNPDGSNQVRLTTDGASDFEPAWSSDKSRIYFASNRSGNYDIWSMNADGSGQAAYAASGNAEFEPTISPNGTVSWVEVTDSNNGIGSIKNAWISGWFLGSDSYRSIGPCKFMARPNWSPDGMRLAYECDIDNDNWTELVVMDFRKPSALTIIDLKESLVDAQLNGWSPDGNQLIFTRVVYKQEGSQLVPISLTPMIVNAFGGQPATLPFTAGGDEAVDWKFVDSLPPTSKIVVPPFTHANAVPSWGASDSGPAGVAFYFVDYSQDSGPWRTVISYTTATTVSLFVSLGVHSMRFRVRAQDKAGNLEAAAETGPSVGETIPYLTAVRGTLTDNRNVPLPFATILITDNVPVSVTTQSNGVFLAPLTSLSDVQPVIRTLTVAKLGYDVLAIKNDGSGISDSNPYLHMTDDVVTNGRFDAKGTGWSTSGNVEFIQGLCLYFGAPLACMRPPQASISQKVTIPVTITRPTLSFISSWTIWSPPDATTESNLIVRVDDGLKQTAVFTSPKVYNSFPGARANPQINWIDMQPWAGKTITLIFTIQTIGSGLIAGQAVIDDISLSSWLTPVPKKIILSRVDPNSSTTKIRIIGENFIAPVTARLNNVPLADVSWINETMLEATLPPDLPFGRYDVFVKNAGGQEHVLLGGLVVGSENFVPVAVR